LILCCFNCINNPPYEINRKPIDVLETWFGPAVGHGDLYKFDHILLIVLWLIS
jgi:hypothetical protein